MYHRHSRFWTIAILALLTLTCQAIGAPTLVPTAINDGGKVEAGGGVTPAHDPNAISPAIPPGAKIIFARSDKLWVVSPDGTDLTKFSNYPYGNDRNPVWSPDGRQIAFSTDRDGNYEIYIMDADGSHQTRLTNNPEIDDSPTWSPDGKRIAFRTGKSVQDVAVINGDGSGFTKITDTQMIAEIFPDWSPDGEWIMVSMYGQNFRGIYKMRPDGSDIQVILPGGLLNGARWSPDGKYIAYDFAPGSCGTEIFIMNADGTGSRQLTHHPHCGYSHNPAWSPDGTQIAYEFTDVPSEGEDGNIYVINVDGSHDAPISHAPPTVSDTEPDWCRVP